MATCPDKTSVAGASYLVQLIVLQLCYNLRSKVSALTAPNAYRQTPLKCDSEGARSKWDTGI